jgi:hypothetical protein
LIRRFMKNTRLVELAIKGLEAEKARIDQELAELRGSVNGHTRTAAGESETSAPSNGRKKRRLSAQARARIAAAQRARWARMRQKSR